MSETSSARGTAAREADEVQYLPKTVDTRSLWIKPADNPAWLAAAKP